MMTKSVHIAALTLLLCTAAAVSQTAIAPPPRPADSGPTVAVTMKFIQDKLNDVGTVACTNSFPAVNQNQESLIATSHQKRIDQTRVVEERRFKLRLTATGEV
jgi:hypothetical protein